uniref:Uncharacterized protein n=1 Tax=Timema genevievae TaxID=629358 RepID=A0A7R9K4T9_TIMGE|nr:unnamed protein product [Timema genevievae]
MPAHHCMARLSARPCSLLCMMPRCDVKSIPFLATSPGKDRVVLVYSDKIEVRTKKHQRGATPESGGVGHEEELNDIQIRLQQSSRSPASEPMDRLSRASLNQPISAGGYNVPMVVGGASLVSINKPNSTTSSTMTASVVVNLPSSYPGSEVEPASVSSPATSPDQPHDAVRISTL